MRFVSFAVFFTFAFGFTLVEFFEFGVEFFARFENISVFERNAVVHYYHSDIAAVRLCKQVPAVVGVAVCNTAVEHIAVSNRQFSRKAVGVFAVGFVVVIVVRSAVFN